MTHTQKTLRLICLARLSDKWRDEPLDRQTADILEVVDELGGVLVGEVLVERVSGSRYRKANVRRPGWDESIRLLEAREADGIVVYNIDRLTREPRAIEDLIDLAVSAGREGRPLIVAGSGQTIDLTTGEGQAYIRGQVTAAARESDAISRRTRRANQSKRGQRPFWSFRPFGFQRDGEHHPTEAAIVRDVYLRFVNGDTLGAIAAWLNAEGITQPERTDKATGAVIAKPWTGNAVRLLLKADRNIGVLRSDAQPGRPVYETQAGGWDPIVDHDTFQAARRLLTTNAARYVTDAGNVRSHLLSGLLICDVCGRRLTSHPVSTGSAKYVCRKDARAGRMGCGLSVSAAPVERIVRDAVLAILADDGARERLAVPQDEAPNTVALLATIQNQKDRVADLLRRTRGADALYTLDDVDEEVREAKALQAAAQAALDRGRAASPTANLPTDLDELAEGWEAWTLAQQQATIADVLAPIVVRKATGRGSVFDPSRLDVVERFPASDVAAA